MVDPRRLPTALGRYWRTARHLRPVQVGNRLARCLPRLSGLGGPVPVLRAAARLWPGPVDRPPAFTSEQQVCLLHRAAPLTDWNPSGLPRLWRYHLHYFDDVTSPHFAAVAARWIADHPPGSQPGWEPYPLSRRVPNWITWLLLGHQPGPGFIASLDRQAGALASQIEYHLLGNHLLANLRALIFAACFFAHRREWAARWAAEFSTALTDQLLPDGGHAERSPMYHALILQDLLDLITLAAVYPGVIPARHVEHWRRQAGRMLGWLSGMCHPDGAIAFFQDAAFDMAPSPESIRAYASRLGVFPVPGEEVASSASGYARLEQAGTVVLVDVAGPGPAYQPGHAHAGALSFELSHHGQRLVVNSGTSTYEPGPDRDYERSTAAHNTVRINGRDQSEMWAAFRVGRRAQVEPVHRTPTSVTARHDGYAPVLHQRQIRLAGGELEVVDQISGAGTQQVELFFHFHPDVTLTQRGSGWEARHRLGPSLRLLPPPEVSAHAEAGQWRPEFGWRIANQRLRLAAPLTLPVTLRTSIELSQ